MEGNTVSLTVGQGLLLIHSWTGVLVEGFIAKVPVSTYRLIMSCRRSEFMLFQQSTNCSHIGCSQIWKH